MPVEAKSRQAANHLIAVIRHQIGCNGSFRPNSGGSAAVVIGPQAAVRRRAVSLGQSS